MVHYFIFHYINLAFNQGGEDDPPIPPFDHSQVITRLPSVQELHLKVSLASHTLLGTHLPLYLFFPRLQCLQIKYYNAKCTACRYRDDSSSRSDLSDSDEDQLEDHFTGLACVRGLVAPLLPHLPQLRMGQVKTVLCTEDGVNCWQLDQLK